MRVELYECYTDHCASQPCLNNGTCSQGNGSFVCDCASELFYGARCENVAAVCKYHPLLNFSQITFSSSKYAVENILTGGWAPKNDDGDPWLQLEFHRLEFVYAIDTKGWKSQWVQAYVKNYSISYGETLAAIEKYKDKDNTEKEQC
ncbi:EGF-like repeat and discoidin I-like domain-containing protein 3 [Dendronephthya gigantea]|uniref:EGF-like repeat and discoidin I-like domain-containing protein 3 n=1 Tax=Dendronephthya gigantea TaxID=151771 RepID=UPI0010695AC5|nr:EGF-like repeat and discoidin I-like domain-containing protein 3 [Dendronephthya gigantea]